MHCYEYPRPAVSVDAVVFGFDGKSLNLLLIRRSKDPFKGKWALPGGFIEMEESCETAVSRELQEETGLKGVPLKQMKIFSAPDRDPRGRVISVAYLALVNSSRFTPEAGDDAGAAQWIPVDDSDSLAFDHDKIVKDARNHLMNFARCEPIGLNVLPESFTFHDVHALYEAVFGRVLNMRTLQRKLMRYRYLVKAENIDTSRKMSAKLIRFDEETYRNLRSKGFVLDI